MSFKRKSHNSGGSVQKDCDWMGPALPMVFENDVIFYCFSKYLSLTELLDKVTFLEVQKVVNFSVDIDPAVGCDTSCEIGC